ncbi:DNA polymerase III subunit gamma and tau [Planosporangium thailandense]|uniref:DNA-directed DNA polymerase n=1 Tax=Planosporangium thailandense TaxID=765197 RepID=A0ABX0Y675_9ACTN|nr:DNA polymerase III subunit gamma and tau [Planosporangium thailandense]
MALALYRKYRPRTFAEVIGQEHVTEPLAQALRSGRLHHAYLFSGPRGCGKTSSARILARSLNCANGPTPEPCGECQSCRDLAPDGAGSIDVMEIDAASHGGVDDARDLRERAFFAPVSSRFKIYVIDEAHMVSAAGFNALLKLVEEPPDYVKFVFATTEPEKVLGTIKSRTHHYPFRLVPPGVLRPYLEKLCESEGVKAEPAVFPLVVRAGGGSVRDTLSVLDQLIAGAGPDGVSYSRAVALLGVTDVTLIDEMCDALAAGDGATAYATVDRVVEAGHDPRRFASDLLERLRDLIVLQQVPDAAAKGLLDVPDDQLERMTAQAARLGPASLSRFADIVHNGLTEMRGTTAPRLLLELVTARMLLPGADDSSSALLQRLERMERRLGAAGEPASAPPSAPPAAAMQVSAAPPTVVTPVAPPPAVAPSVPAVASSSAAERSSAPTSPAAPSVAASAPPSRPSTPVGPRPAEPAPAGAVAPARPAAEAQASDRGQAPGVLDAAAIRRRWDEIVSATGRKKKATAALARDATVRDVEGNTVVLLLQHRPLAEMLSRSADVLSQAITEVFGGTWQIRCDVGGGTQAEVLRGAGAARSAPAPAPQPAPRDAPSSGHAMASPRDPRPASRRSDPADGGDDDWPTPARPGGGIAPTASASPAEDPAEDPADDWPTPARPGGQAVADGAAPGDAVNGGPAPSGPVTGVPGAAPTAVAGAAPTAVAGAAPTAVAGAAPTAVAGAAPTAAAGPTPPAAGPTPPAAGPTPPAPTAAGFATAVRSPSAPSAPPASAGPAPAAAPVSSGRSAALAAARAAAAGLSGRQAVDGRAGGPVPAVQSAPASAPPGRAAAPTAGGGGWRDGSPVDEPPYDPDYDGPVSDPEYPGFDPGDEPTDEVLDERVIRESTEEQALRLLAEALGAERIDDGHR